MTTDTTAPAHRTPAPVTLPRIVQRMTGEIPARLRPTVYIPTQALRSPTQRTA